MYFAHRFSTFRKASDAEMGEANKLGIAQQRKKPQRGDVTEEEELELWRQNLLGGHSAESLLNTLYFYNGKLFGLRANEHRLLRIRFHLAPFQVKVQVVLWKMLRAMEHSIILPLTLL